MVTKIPKKSILIPHNPIQIALTMAGLGAGVLGVPIVTPSHLTHRLIVGVQRTRPAVGRTPWIEEVCIYVVIV